MWDVVLYVAVSLNGVLAVGVLASAVECCGRGADAARWSWLSRGHAAVVSLLVLAVNGLHVAVVRSTDWSASACDVGESANELMLHTAFAIVVWSPTVRIERVLRGTVALYTQAVLFAWYLCVATGIFGHLIAMLLDNATDPGAHCGWPHRPTGWWYLSTSVAVAHAVWQAVVAMGFAAWCDATPHVACTTSLFGWTFAVMAWVALCGVAVVVGVWVDHQALPAGAPSSSSAHAVEPLATLVLMVYVVALAVGPRLQHLQATYLASFGGTGAWYRDIVPDEVHMIAPQPCGPVASDDGATDHG